MIRDKVQFPSSYWMSPKEESQYMGIVKLLLHFRWTWTTLVAPDSEDGDGFVKTLSTMIARSGNCVAFAWRLPTASAIVFDGISQTVQNYRAELMQRKAKVFIYYGDPNSLFAVMLILQYLDRQRVGPVGKVWVTTTLWGFSLSTSFVNWDVTNFHGALSFMIRMSESFNVRELFFIRDEASLVQIWKKIFQCYNLVSHKTLVPRWPWKIWNRCVGKGSPPAWLEKKIFAESYVVYNAVFIMAHSLDRMRLSEYKHKMPPGRLDLHNAEPWQVRGASSK